MPKYGGYVNSPEGITGKKTIPSLKLTCSHLEHGWLEPDHRFPFGTLTSVHRQTVLVSGSVIGLLIYSHPFNTG